MKQPQQRIPGIWAMGVAALLLTACGTPPPETPAKPAPPPAPAPAPPPPPPTSPAPQHIEVQHILIGFAGSVPGKSITRTLAEAKTLAYDVLEQARNGKDFDALVAKHTDDAAPGKYRMANFGVGRADSKEFLRQEMVPAFGNVGFELAVGGIGIADHDPQTSPFGYHIIKRTQ